MNEELIKLAFSKFEGQGSYEDFKKDFIKSKELREFAFSKLESSDGGTFEDFEKDLGLSIAAEKTPPQKSSVSNKENNINSNPPSIEQPIMPNWHKGLFPVKEAEGVIITPEQQRQVDKENLAKGSRITKEKLIRVSESAPISSEEGVIQTMLEKGKGNLSYDQHDARTWTNNNNPTVGKNISPSELAEGFYQKTKGDIETIKKEAANNPFFKVDLKGRGTDIKTNICIEDAEGNCVETLTTPSIKRTSFEEKTLGLDRVNFQDALKLNNDLISGLTTKITLDRGEDFIKGYPNTISILNNLAKKLESLSRDIEKKDNSDEGAQFFKNIESRGNAINAISSEIEGVNKTLSGYNKEFEALEEEQLNLGVQYKTGALPYTDYLRLFNEAAAKKDNKISEFNEVAARGKELETQYLSSIDLYNKEKAKAPSNPLITEYNKTRERLTEVLSAYRVYEDDEDFQELLKAYGKSEDFKDVFKVFAPEEYKQKILLEAQDAYANAVTLERNSKTRGGKAWMDFKNTLKILGGATGFTNPNPYIKQESLRLASTPTGNGMLPNVAGMVAGWLLNTANDFFSLAELGLNTVGVDEKTLKKVENLRRDELSFPQSMVNAAMGGGKRHFYEEQLELNSSNIGESSFYEVFKPGDKLVIDNGEVVGIRSKDSDILEGFLSEDTKNAAQDIYKANKDKTTSSFSLVGGIEDAVPSIIDLLAMMYGGGAISKMARGLRLPVVPVLEKYGIKTGTVLGEGFITPTTSVGFSFLQQYGDIYDSHIQRGVGVSDALNYAFKETAVSSFMEIMFSPFEMKLQKSVNSRMFGQLIDAKNATIRDVISGRTPLIGWGDTFLKYTKQKGGALLEDYIKDVIPEVATEILENYNSAYWEAESKDEMIKLPSFSENVNAGFGAAFITAAVGLPSANSKYNIDLRATVTYNAVNNPNGIISDTDFKTVQEAKEWLNKYGLVTTDEKLKKKAQQIVLAYDEILPQVKKELEAFEGENLTEEQKVAIAGAALDKAIAKAKLLKETDKSSRLSNKLGSTIAMADAQIDYIVKNPDALTADPILKSRNWSLVHEDRDKHKGVIIWDKGVSPDREYKVGDKVDFGSLGSITITEIGKDASGNPMFRYETNDKKKAKRQETQNQDNTEEEEVTTESTTSAQREGATTTDGEQVTEEVVPQGGEVKETVEGVDFSVGNYDIKGDKVAKRQVSADGATTTTVDVEVKDGQTVQEAIEEHIDANRRQELDSVSNIINQEDKAYLEERINQRADKDLQDVKDAFKDRGTASQANEVVEPKQEVDKPSESQQVVDDFMQEFDNHIAELGITAEINLALDDIGTRMNNAEYITEAELEGHSTKLYEIWDKVDNDNRLTSEQKESIKSKLENEIEKLESYELATENKVGVTTERTAVKSTRIVGRTKSETPTRFAVTPERFEGLDVTVTAPNGESKVGSFVVFSGGTIGVEDGDGNILPVTDGYTYTETLKDKEGNVTGGVLTDNGSGFTYTINDSDLALDIAIKAKEEALGGIYEPLFEEAVVTVTKEVKVEPKLTREDRVSVKPNKNENVTPLNTDSSKGEINTSSNTELSSKETETPKKTAPKAETNKITFKLTNTGEKEFTKVGDLWQYEVGGKTKTVRSESNIAALDKELARVNSLEANMPTTPQQGEVVNEGSETKNTTKAPLSVEDVISKLNKLLVDPKKKNNRANVSLFGLDIVFNGIKDNIGIPLWNRAIKILSNEVEKGTNSGKAIIKAANYIENNIKGKDWGRGKFIKGFKGFFNGLNKRGNNKGVTVSITPYAGARIQKYKNLQDSLNAFITAGNFKAAQEVAKEMQDDLIFRLNQLLPDVKIKGKSVDGLWQGSAEQSFSLHIDKVSDDVFAAIVKIAQDFDQDAVHILYLSDKINNDEIVGVEDANGRAIIPVVNFEFKHPITAAEFGKIVKDNGIDGASLDSDGYGAVIYDSTMYATKEEAEKGHKEFFNKINNIYNDSKGTYGTKRAVEKRRFANYKRSGQEKGGRTYAWGHGNIQKSDEYRARENDERTAAGWAVRNLPKKVRDAVQKVASLTPKIGTYLTLNKSSDDYKRLQSIGRMFDRMPIVDLSPKVKSAYNTLNEIIKAQYDRLPIKVYPNNRPIISHENIEQIQGIVNELNTAIEAKDIKKITELQKQLDNVVGWSENRYDDAYSNSKQMMADVNRNNQMEFFTTGSGFGDGSVDYTGHPLLEPTHYYTTPVPAQDKNGKIIYDKDGNEVLIPKQLLNNDVLRVVHDYVAHAASGASFGAKGEERAWAAHVASIINEQGFSDRQKLIAIQALTSETRGQNTWVNFVNEFNRDIRNPLLEIKRNAEKNNDLDTAAKADDMLSELPYTEFADQKVGLLPTETMIGGYESTADSDKWIKDKLEKEKLYESEQSEGNMKEQSLPEDISDVGEFIEDAREKDNENNTENENNVSEEVKNDFNNVLNKETTDKRFQADGQEVTAEKQAAANKILDFIKDKIKYFKDGKNIVVDAKEFANKLRELGFGDLRAMAWSKNFPIVIPQTNLRSLRNHPDYDAAKNKGDYKAAERVVKDIIKKDKINTILSGNKDVTIVPVLAEEGKGLNKLPLAYARELAKESNGEVAGISQTNVTSHTDSGAIERMFRTPNFNGEVIKGKKYLIVDDVVTSGSTVRALKEYIENNGGKVIGVSSLSNISSIHGGYSGNLAIKQDTIKKLREKFIIRQLNSLLLQYGIAEKYQDLTNAQAIYLLQFKDIDRLRDKFNDAGILSRLKRSGEEGRSEGETDRVREVSQENLRLLSTPQGDVYGFVHGGKMYLDPNKLTPDLVGEEFIHLQQQGLRLAAESGNKEAKRIVDAWDALTNDAAEAFMTDAQEGGISEEARDLLNLLGIPYKEMSADAYKRQDGESDADYKLRLQDELWAKAQKKDFAERAEKLSEEGKLSEIGRKVYEAVKDFFRFINESLGLYIPKQWKNLSLSEIIDRTNEVITSDKFLQDLKRAEEAIGVKDDKSVVKKMMIGGKEVEVKTLPQVTNGFYSPIEKKLLDEKAENLSATKWLERLGKGDEVQFTGLKDFLESKKPNEQVKKSEIQDFMRDNRIEVVEVVKGGDASEAEIDAFLEDEMGQDMTREEAREYLSNDETNEQTKYHNYQLDGEKENYKEVLVTMPSKKVSEYSIKERPSPRGVGVMYDVVHNKTNRVVSSHRDAAEAMDNLKQYNKNIVEDKQMNFKSTHFDEPNILVHLRMNTRTDSEGNKVLFLEEVQSDWGQQGKKEGFKGSEPVFKVEKVDGGVRLYADGKVIDQSTNDRFNSLFNGDEKYYIESFKDAVKNMKERDATPTAPFVTETPSWVKLGLKVALKEAVKQGADKIAWTTGEQQNERYDLSKQVDEIGWQKNENGTYNITPKKDGSVIGTREMMANLTIKQIEDYVGKEVAEKIQNEEGKVWDGGSVKQGKLTGQQLKVGGKGMIGFYGNPSEGKLGIVGQVAKSLFKQEPQTIELQNTVTLSGNQNKILRFRDWVWANETKDYSFADAEKDIENNNELYAKYQSSIPTQHAITITPEMRQQAQEGQPLFMAGYNQYLSKSDFDSNGNVKPEVLEEIRKEREKIVREAKANGTYMKAPNGKATNLNEQQWVDVRTKRFKDWFGDWEGSPENASKVVDENGEPLVVYHTSDVEFYKFDENKIGKNYTLRHGNGFYFSSGILGHRQWGSINKMLFLNIRNIRKSSLSFREEAKENGFLNTYDNSVDIASYAKKDGVDGLFAGDSFNKEFIVFFPNQIKSASSNVGTFSNESNDIRFSISNSNTNFNDNETEGGVKPTVNEGGSSTIDEVNNIDSATRPPSLKEAAKNLKDAVLDLFIGGNNNLGIYYDPKMEALNFYNKGGKVFKTFVDLMKSVATQAGVATMDSKGKLVWKEWANVTQQEKDGLFTEFRNALTRLNTNINIDEDGLEYLALWASDSELMKAKVKAISALQDEIDSLYESFARGETNRQDFAIKVQEVLKDFNRDQKNTSYFSASDIAKLLKAAKDVKDTASLNNFENKFYDIVSGKDFNKLKAATVKLKKAAIRAIQTIKNPNTTSNNPNGVTQGKERLALSYNPLDKRAYNKLPQVLNLQRLPNESNTAYKRAQRLEAERLYREDIRRFNDMLTVMANKEIGKDSAKYKNDINYFADMAAHQFNIKEQEKALRESTYDTDGNLLDIYGNIETLYQDLPAEYQEVADVRKLQFDNNGNIIDTDGNIIKDFNSLDEKELRELERRKKLEDKELNKIQTAAEKEQARLDNKDKIRNLINIGRQVLPFKEFQAILDDFLSITDEQLEKLSNQELEELIKGYDNLINLNRVNTGFEYLIKKALDGSVATEVINTLDSRGNSFRSLLRDRITNIFKGKNIVDGIERFMRNTPLRRIDAIFSGKEGTEMYDTFIYKIAQGMGVFTAFSNKLKDEYRGLTKSIKQDDEFLLRLYTMDRQYRNNPDSDEIMSVAEEVELIREAISLDKNLKESLYADFVELYDKLQIEHGGEFDYTKIQLDKRQQALLDFVDTHLDNTVGKVVVTAARTGEATKIYNNYTPLGRVSSKSITDEMKDFADGIMDFDGGVANREYFSPITPGFIKARQSGKISPIRDVLFSRVTYEAIRGIHLDYNMRDAFKTFENRIKDTERELDNKIKDIRKDAKDKVEKLTEQLENQKQVLTFQLQGADARTARVLNGQIADIDKQIKALDESDIIKASEEKIDAYKNDKMFIQVMGKVVKDVAKDTLHNQYTPLSGIDIYTELVASVGYASVLTSIPRGMAEFASNIFYASLYPVEMMLGVKQLAKMLKDDKSVNRLKELLTQIPSTQPNRLIVHSGSLRRDTAETKKFGIAATVGRGKRIVENLTSVIDSVNDAILGTSDRVISMPMWLGAFEKEFNNQKRIEIKNRLGRSNYNSEYEFNAAVNREFKKERLNLEEFVNNSDYRFKNKVISDKAVKFADRVLTEGFASFNAFEGIPNLKMTKGDGFLKVYDKFLQRFNKFEYQSFEDSISSLLGRGYLSKNEAARVLTATLSRLAIYNYLTGKLRDWWNDEAFAPAVNAVSNTIGEALGVEGDKDLVAIPDRVDNTEEEDLYKKKRAFIGGLISVSLQRRLGGLGRLPINFAVEMANGLYGEDLGLRKGAEYNAYENSLLFSSVKIPNFTSLQREDGELSDDGLNIPFTDKAMGLKAISPDKYLIDLFAGITGPYSVFSKNMADLSRLAFRNLGMNKDLAFLKTINPYKEQAVIDYANNIIGYKFLASQIPIPMAKDVHVVMNNSLSAINFGVAIKDNDYKNATKSNATQMDIKLGVKAVERLIKEETSLMKERLIDIIESEEIFNKIEDAYINGIGAKTPESFTVALKNEKGKYNKKNTYSTFTLSDDSVIWGTTTEIDESDFEDLSEKGKLVYDVYNGEDNTTKYFEVKPVRNKYQLAQLNKLYTYSKYQKVWEDIMVKLHSESLFKHVEPYEREFGVIGWKAKSTKLTEIGEEDPDTEIDITKYFRN